MGPSAVGRLVFVGPKISVASGLRFLALPSQSTTGWASSATETCLTDLEAAGLKSSQEAGLVSSEAVRENLFHAFLLAPGDLLEILAVPWLVAALPVCRRSSPRVSLFRRTPAILDQGSNLRHLGSGAQPPLFLSHLS